MKKLSEKGRKLLRIVYRSLGAVALLLGFQGCDLFPAPAYGMPVEYGPGPDWKRDVTIRGAVISKALKPIPGIKVSVKDLPSYGFTNANGNFSVYVPEQESYKLKFEDVDGPANGSFKPLKKKIALNDTGVTLYVQLDEEDEE